MAKLKWYGDRALTKVMKAAIQAIQICAADLQGKSSKQAPIDNGDLRANCSVSPLQQNGKQVWLKVGYDLPYAIVQHERLDFRHPKGGGPKYLENPFKENVAKYERYIEQLVKQALAKD